MEAVRRRVSFADLKRMPDDGNRYELYDGELRVVPSPMPRHQIVSMRLTEVLIEYRRLHGGLVVTAPFDIVLSDYNVVEPDVIYFKPDTATRIELDRHVRFAPDLAIEILSPSTAAIDRGRKRDLLARYAVPEYWVVDMKKRTLHRFSGPREGDYPAATLFREGEEVASVTLPGVAIRLAFPM